MVMMVADTYLPVSLSVPGMTDAQFQELCEQYADYRLEYTAEGELILVPLTDAETSSRNAMIVYLLMKWAIEQGRGTVTESSGGFVLSNGARLAPDAAWISRERFRRKPICPEFVIELMSPSDRPRKVQEKMREWVANGVDLGWLIDPRTQTVTVYRPQQEPEARQGITSIAGEGPVEGLVLDLSPIWSI